MGRGIFEQQKKQHNIWENKTDSYTENIIGMDGYVDAGGKTEICRYVVVDTSENAIVFVVAANRIAMVMVVLRNGIIVKASEAVNPRFVPLVLISLHPETRDRPSGTIN